MATTKVWHSVLALLSALLVLGIVPLPATTAHDSESHGQAHYTKEGEATRKTDSALSAPALKDFSLPDLSMKSLGIPLDSGSLHRQIVSNVHLSLRCDEVWKGPSAKNDILKCVTDAEHLKKNWSAFVIPGIGALLFVVLLVSYPIVCLSMCCSRGCCKSKAGKSVMAARCCVWMWIVYALLWNVLVLVLIISGAQLLVKSFPVIVEDIESGPLHYFNSTGEKVLDFTSNWSTGERKPLPEYGLDLTPFYDIQSQVRSYLDKAHQMIFRHMDLISIILYCAGLVGFVLVLLIVPFACLHCCIPFFPFIISLVYWIFGLVFILLSTAFAVACIAFTAGCGEIELQYRRQPGVFQWYLVPLLQETMRFDEIRENMQQKELIVSSYKCNKLLKICDNKPDSNGSSPALPIIAINHFARVGDVPDFKESSIPLQNGNCPKNLIPKIQKMQTERILQGFDNPSVSDKFYADLSEDNPNELPPERVKRFESLNLPEPVKYLIKNGGFNASLKIIKCGGGITSGNQCSDFNTLSQVLFESKVKAVVAACPCKSESCGVVECAYNCTIPFVTNIAVEIMQEALQARNATIALSYYKPVPHGNFVMDKLTSSMKTCNDFRMATLMLGGGFFLGGLTFCLAIYIALRGSCIWKKMRK